MENKSCYIYTRVSTSMQVDGYSLDAQKDKLRKYAEFQDLEVKGKYCDEGKLGKSVEGRIEFQRMLEDIRSLKDNVDYVLVFKLSRFGRNAADVLNSLQIMQDFGTNLICVEDGIDSSKDSGKLMISVLSAVAEIERENILVQTMEGRKQKAREGKWNGGFAPYGYKLVNGELEIAEDEAEAIRLIFDLYANTDMGANYTAKYLETHNIRKKPRQNGKYPYFTAHLIIKIIDNPVYNGKIAYGRRKTEKVKGTRNEYKQVRSDDYLLVEGIHKAIIDDKLWDKAQRKHKSQVKKYEVVDRLKNQQKHLLSGMIKCPICGAGMYGNKSSKRKKDGTKYKDYYFYGCKHRKLINGHRCTYNKQINEEVLNDAVIEIVTKLVRNKKLLESMKEKIDSKINTTDIDIEIENFQKQLRQLNMSKINLLDDIGALDPEDKHYKAMKSDLNDRLYSIYDKIEDINDLLEEAYATKQTIEKDKITSDNIYEILTNFDVFYQRMNKVEQRKFIELLIDEIQIYKERQPNGQWIKSIKFKLPLLEETLGTYLDKNSQDETVVLMSKVNPTK
jgi:hypothetical protein